MIGPSVPETIPPPPPVSLPRGRRVIVIGGGRGGVGKSTLTVNLAVYFAQLGRNVVVCDADPTGSNLHAMLGLPTAPLTAYNPDDPELSPPVPTPLPGLSILPAAFDLVAMAPVRPTRRVQWQNRIANTQADYVLVHLGTSATMQSLDLFSSGDVSICVTAPDPVSVEHTYSFVRALFARGLRRRLMKEKLKLKLAERALSSLQPMASPLDIVSAIARYDHALGRVAAEELARLHPRLVVGQTRLRADLELGSAMGSISERFLGTRLDYLGHIEHDDSVWLSIRRMRPLLVESPTSKSARNIERIARRVLALLMSMDAPGEPKLRPEFNVDIRRPSLRTLYEVLGVARAAADDEIRRAYKRQREIFRHGSFPAASVVSDKAIEEEQARIEEAYDTLLDPNKRRAYELSTFPADAKQERREPHIDEARAAELLALQKELEREINTETLFTGDLLRRCREAQGVSLADIAERSKISTTHLAAIESERVEDLPALVYVQGFVQEIAKYLKLDAAQVSRTLLRRLRDLAEHQSSTT